MTKFSLALLCVSSAIVQMAVGLCPAGVVQGQSPDACFIVQSTPTTWLAAEESCIRSNGHLASISDQIANLFLLILARQHQLTSRYWLGGSVGLQHGDGWAWADGQRVSYTNWAKDQLTNGTRCLSVDANCGQWQSERCDAAMPSICRVAPAAPAPTDPSANSSCPTGWTYMRQTKKCHTVIQDDSGLAWNEAFEKCQHLNATLASIPDRDANSALFEFAKQFKPDPAKGWIFGGYWIGLYRVGKAPSAFWQWTDGTPFWYTNWYRGPAEDGGDIGYGTHVALIDGRGQNDSTVDSGGRWDAADNHGHIAVYYALCQRNPVNP